MEGFESVLGALALAGARGEKIQVGADGSEIGRVVNAAVRERILVETPGSPGELDFRHRRMREFLAARILALQEKRPDLALGRSLDAVDMEQMITLYAGMTPDPRDLVESLLRDPPDDAKHAGPLRVTLRTHRRLILAARSLGAAQGKCEDLRADVQERLQQILIDGNAAERVEAVDALQSVMPQDKYVAALSDSVDESPWVHEMALSKLQTSTVAPSALVRIARRHMDSIPFRRLLRIVWHNAHFLTIPRSAAVVFAGVLAALGRILPAVVGWPLLAMIPGLTVWSRLHWESLRGSLMVHANPNLVGVFAAGALLTALTWLLLRGVARLRWSIAMAPGLLLPSLGTNLAAERLLNGWTSVEAPALPLPPAATISARLPEFLVLRDVAVYVLTISCGVFVWRRFRDRRAAAPATSEVTAQGGSILDRGWSMLLPPFFMIAVSMLVFYYVPESPLSRPGTILGALIFLGLIVWVALYRRKQRREYLTLVNRLLLSDPNQSVDTVLTYLSGGHARKYKAGIIRVLESRLLQPGESALSEIRNFQIEPWGSAEMKDDLWKSYRILERRFLRRLDSEAA